MNFILLIALLSIFIALAIAGFFMIRRQPTPSTDPSRMMRALAWRVALSISAFALVWLAHALGWIQPSGIPLGR